MGAGRWAMEMWVGSHPSIIPCHLSVEPDIKEWQYDDRNSSAFSFTMFPREGHDMRTMFRHSEPRYSESNLDSIKIRMLDFNLLGGMTMRWRLNYGEQPSPSSWMWSYYPDGEVWLRGLEEYGDKEVFDKLTSTYIVKSDSEA